MDSPYWDAPVQIKELDLQRLEASFDRRIAELDARWNRKWPELDAKLTRLDADYRKLRDELRTELSDRRSAEGTANAIRWMLFFWVLTLVPLGWLILYVALRP